MKRLIRIAIACTGLLLVSAGIARAQTAYRETGSVTVGGYFVWVRGTNAKVVELFVGRGFRDAFARPHDIDAARLQQWVDSVRAATPVAGEDSGSADAQLRGVALGEDVTMLRRVGGSFSGLRLLVNGEDPIRMAEPTAREFIAMLDSAARVTRELSVPPPSIMASMPLHSAPAITEAPVAKEMMVAEAPHEVVVSAPSQPVAMLGSSGEVSPLPKPTIAPAPAPTPAPALAPAVTPAPVAAPIATPAPQLVVPPRDTVVAPHVDVPSDKLIRTPLGPFTIPGALLSDRDKEAQYCYKQLGLKYNPDLKGEITVKLSVRSDGAVQDATVTKRSWQGISAGEVESCVRALAHDWTFASSDPSVTDGAKVVTFSFAP